MPRYIIIGTVLASIVLMANIPAAYAQTTDATGQYNTFLNLFRSTAASWEGALRGYANSLFWLLAGIEVILVFMPLVFRGTDIAEVMAEMVRLVLIIGFFYLLLLQGPTWADDIITSLRQAGANAGGTSQALSPAAVLAAGFDIGALITLNLNIFSPGIGLAFVVAWVVLILAFAYIAALVAVALIESYIITFGAVIFLGLGGSRFTREYAIGVLRYALAVGAKLFTLTLIVNLMQGAFGAWAAFWNETVTAASVLMGLSLLAALITKMIPDLIQSMIMGSTGSGNQIGGMATTMLAGGAALVSGGLAGAAAGGAAGGAAAGGAAAGGAGGGAVSGGAGIAQAMQASMADRPGLTPGLASGGTSSATPPRPATAAGPSGGSAGQGGGGRAANAAVKTVGTMAELTVPGMEGASAVGIPPQVGPMPDLDGDNPSSESDAAMVIEPAQNSGGENTKKT